MRLAGCPMQGAATSVVIFWLGEILNLPRNKFHKDKHILLNKHVSLVLRLKLFDAVVSPAMLFGLATLPLTKGCLQKLGVVQRRMLRSIVGWVRIHDDLNWRDCEKFIANGGLGRQTLPIEVSTCTSDCTLT